jgi:hypothetical protein
VRFVRQLDRLAEMGDSFFEGGAPHGLVPSLAPPFDRGIVEPGLGEVMRQHLGLGCGDGPEVIAQGLGHDPVQHLAPALQQILIGRVQD